MTGDDVTIGPCRLLCGDALNVLPTLPDASVHLICVDPPYMGMKLHHNGARVEWDRQWPTRAAYLAWLRSLALEWKRLLTPNGSLYCFASPQMAAYVEVMLGEVFQVLQRITWAKPPFATKAEMFDKESCRMYFPASEAILFCEQSHADSMALGESGYAAQCEELHGFVFEPLRAYLEGERKRAAISKATINEACGFAPIPGAMASRHYFSPSQWQLPTKDHYVVMQKLFNAQGRYPAPAFADYHPQGSAFAKFHPTADEFLRADYESLRADYESLRADYESLRTDYESLRADYESLRRPFTINAEVPYSDTWHFPTVQAYPGKHAAEKPLALYRHIVMASSRPGDTCLDCTAGSFAFLDAVRQCGRQGIGIEQDRRWWQKGCQRLSQGDLFTAPAVAPRYAAQQLSLVGGPP